VPALTYPGVYVEEVSSGVRPLEIAGTSTAAFVGLAERGPDTGAPRVTSWAQFQREFGSFIIDGHMPLSVFQFFNNGGRQCYVIRMTRDDADAASVTVQNRADPPTAGLVLEASSPGAWGNFLVAQIRNGSADPDNEFRISIRRQPDATVVPKDFLGTEPVEDFDDLSMDPDAPNFVADVLERRSALVRARVSGENTAEQAGVHRGGRGAKVPLEELLNLQIAIDDDGVRTVALPPDAGALDTLAEVAAALQAAVRALDPVRTSTDPDAYPGFTCTAEGDGTQARLVLTSGSTGPRSSVRVVPGAPSDASGLLKLGAANGGRSEGGIALRRPPVTGALQLGDAATKAPVVDTTPGDDGLAPLTETSFREAFARLDTIFDVSLLAVPGEVAVGARTLMDLGTEYCAGRPLQDLFYIGETDAEDNTPALGLAFRDKVNTANSYGALYFPWVTGPDPTGRSSTPVPLPPSGYVAGLYARTDAARGVWKAPAGTAARLNGVAGLVTEVGDVDHGNLNRKDVAVLRRFPGVGVVAFGARTVASDPEWRYIPVRRTAIMLRVSIYRGIQWAVFEPNDEVLWSQLRLTIGSFMTTLFRQGAFQGASANDAFFVKCDADTTTQADIDAGVVNVLVGFAPLKPAEFVVVRISQQAGAASA